MLLFDNAIFATFIPQMLMFLGYISCVVAPFLTFSTSDNTTENQTDSLVAQRIEINEQFSVSPEVAKSFHYHDFFQSEVADIITENQTFIPYFKIDSVIPQSSGHTNQAFLFTLFSRPPPFYC
ncbi:MAG: hypothetical protein JXR27_00825 [Paludibacteraceae bacterium]|nr:hypothetical protein [Paludibacteraceae bacterium]